MTEGPLQVILISRPDGVVFANDPDQASEIDGAVLMRVHTPHTVYSLVEEAPIQRRWFVGTDDAGVLTIAAWTAEQDRDEDDPFAVMRFAPGAWAAVQTVIPHVDGTRLS